MIFARDMRLKAHIAILSGSWGAIFLFKAKLPLQNPVLATNSPFWGQWGLSRAKKWPSVSQKRSTLTVSEKKNNCVNLACKNDRYWQKCFEYTKPHSSYAQKLFKISLKLSKCTLKGPKMVILVQILGPTDLGVNRSQGQQILGLTDFGVNRS